MEVFNVSNFYDRISRDEEVIIDGCPHWAVFIIPGILCFFSSFVSLNSFFILFVALFLPISIRYFTTKILLTNKRIIGEMGWINTQSINNPLAKIHAISVKSGLFGKVFGYGDITVNTGGSSMTFKGITSPEKFANLVNEFLM